MQGEPTRGTKGMPRERRVPEVLDAAAEEFGRNKFAGTSVVRIAERAGVSKALVLSYFKSKELLYVACVERAGKSLADSIELVLQDPQPAAEMAHATLLGIFSALGGRPHDWNLLMDRTLPAGGPARLAAREARQTIASQAFRGVNMLLDLQFLSDDEDVAILAGIWMSMVEAIVSWWIDHPDRSVEEMTARTARLFTAITGRPIPLTE